MTTPTFPLGLLIAAPPTESILQVRLYKAPENIRAAALELSDLVPVDTPGVGPSAVALWHDAEVLAAGFVQRRSKTLEFRCTGANAGCVARGYYVTAFDGTNTILLGAEEFDAPRPMAASGDTVSLVATVAGWKNTAA